MVVGAAVTTGAPVVTDATGLAGAVVTVGVTTASVGAVTKTLAVARP